ncbi:MAG TPA: alpha/beta fold hydrolase [Candidatus Obscuribacterales bacterium]
MFVACLAGFVVLAGSASAAVARSDEGELAALSPLPLIEWRDHAVKPQGVIVMIHGVTLHAGVFDVSARALAARGFVVVAPDLRGFGRWQQKRELRRDERRVNYSRSQQDVIGLIDKVRKLHPGLPVYVVGESLGANMAVGLAAARPDLVDGLVLSSPCIARHIFLVASMLTDVVRSLPAGNGQLSMKSYIRSRLSEDAKIVEGYQQDPAIRKTLSLRELIQSRFALKRGYLAARGVPARLPVLIMQGTADRLFKPRGVYALVESLPCADERVKWFDGRGHLLLETAYVAPEVLDTMTDWLSERAAQPGLPATAARVPESKEATEPDALKHLQ